MIGVSNRGTYLDRGTKSTIKVDPWLLLSAGFLIGVGVMAIYSEGYGRAGGGAIKQHLIRVAIGIVPFLIFLKVNPNWWRKMAVPLYVINLALLGLVHLRGSLGGGAQRWLQLGPVEFQPSEMSKLVAVLTLSAFYANRIQDVRRFRTFLLSFLYILPSLYLVFKQPHLGATLVLIIAWLSISIFANVPWKFILGMFAAVVAMVLISFSVPGILAPYQKQRIEAMFTNDEQGKDFQQLRASIAFGVGGVSGVGYLQGEQKAGHFIPEQHTDFIFTVIGEEGGLVGCCLVLAGFAFFFFRSWLVMYRVDDPYPRMLAAGIVSILAFHTVVNIAMNLQVGPVVGLWLPFISYGGTAFWLCMACLGLLLNLSKERRSIIFAPSETGSDWS